ncbi:MAG: dihydroorotate dehydrogenase electron transfer subunit [Clostridiales bacterium]|nr:dihydroorotate dehydrogenase electron transfer subunit [Clostridiales bacterium]
MIKDFSAQIKKISALSDTTFDFELFVGETAKEAAPGRFVSISCGDQRILRRPISICDASPSEGTIRIIFEIRGEGTKWLSEQKVGGILKVLGPVGNGFKLGGLCDLPALFVAGGIGTPPIYYAAKNTPGKNDLVAGFRNKSAVILEEDMLHIANAVMVCTDDGSYGIHGLVTTEVEKLLLKQQYGAIFACGPRAMLKATAELAEQYHIPCQVSLEERMGCSVGACLVCACAIKGKDGMEYKHVCKDGPVFDAKDVQF